MSSVSSQYETSYPEALCTALMNLIWAEVRDLILTRVRSPWHERLVFPRLTLAHLLRREALIFAVRDTKQPIVCKLGDH